MMFQSLPLLMTHHSRFALACWLGAFTCGLGCSGESVPRDDLSGKAMYGGNPIPRGVISFTPDSEQGNHGPGSMGDIHDGQFQTRPGKGIVGGAYIVTVHGFANDSNGTPLFAPYEMQVTLPATGGVYDFDIPASAPKANSASGARSGPE